MTEIKDPNEGDEVWMTELVTIAKAGPLEVTLVKPLSNGTYELDIYYGSR